MSFYLDDAVQAEKRVNNPKNLLNEAQFKTVGMGKHSDRGHKEGDTIRKYRKLSPETKGLVSALAQVSSPISVAKSFNIAAPTVRSLSRGMTSDGKHPDPEVRKEASSVLETLGRKSADLVQDSLDRLLNPARLNEAKTPELGQIAAIAMNIFEKTQPKQNNTFISGSVVFMTPPMKQEQQFLEVEVMPVVD